MYFRLKRKFVHQLLVLYQTLFYRLYFFGGFGVPFGSQYDETVLHDNGKFLLDPGTVFVSTCMW